MSPFPASLAVSALFMLSIGTLLSAFQSTSSLGLLVWSRGVDVKKNWQDHTLRSLLEGGSWLSVIIITYVSMENQSSLVKVLFPAMYAGLSGVIVCAASDSVLNRLVVKSSKKSSHVDNWVCFYLIMYVGLFCIRFIFSYLTVCLTALALASVAGTVMVLIGETFSRLDTTSHAGQIIQSRIYNCAKNWEMHPVRSLWETSVWLGAIWSSYSFHGQMMSAIQFGTIVGILGVLLSYELAKLNTIDAKDAKEELELALAAGNKLPEKVPGKTLRQKLPEYTMEEVAKHNTVTDCWIVYQGGVYNISKWAKHHPGGIRPIERFAGLDATDELRAFHQDWVFAKKFPLFLVGHVSDAPEPSQLVKDFRALYKYLDAKSYFQSDLSYYYPKFASLALIFTAVWALVTLSSNNNVHLLAAVLLGVFFQQFAFVGHDCGHISVNVDRAQDYNMGLFAGNFFTGISIGWWKDTHNTHHAVPNSVADDPDICHLPIIAVTDKYFASLYNSYHARVFEFDWAARNVFVPYQHWLYYPIMAVARFNLYIQSYIRLIKAPNVYRRTEDTLYLMGFAVWMGLLLSFLNSWGMVAKFLLLSHAVAGLLQVQITLSHFSRPTNDGRSEGYGGDFYTRQVIASLDVDCHPWLDWFHGGLQFQTLHHLFPRVCRRNLRSLRPLIQALCAKHDLPYTEMSFLDGNKEIIHCLRDTAMKARVWSPLIWESVNAEG